MRIYHVFNTETGYDEEFYTLSSAKKAMKEQNAKGTIYKYWSNGDFECLGEIQLKGSNKHFVANTRQKTAGYR